MQQGDPSQLSNISRRRFLTTLGISGAVASGLGSSYGFAIEPAMRLKVTHYRVSPRKWPARLRLRIAAIADLHAGEWPMPAERVHSIAKRANTLGADVIVLLGDFVAGPDLRTGDIAPEEWPSPSDRSRRHWACMLSSATMTGGTMSRRKPPARDLL